MFYAHELFKRTKLHLFTARYNVYIRLFSNKRYCYMDPLWGLFRVILDKQAVYGGMDKH